jgi:hypothetical protein
MLSALSRLLGAVQQHPGTPLLEALYVRVDKLERAEVERTAEHAAMVDRLERLYKRVSTRIARESQPEDAAPVPGVSPLALKRRIRG